MWILNEKLSQNLYNVKFYILQVISGYEEEEGFLKETMVWFDFEQGVGYIGQRVWMEVGILGRGLAREKALFGEFWVILCR